MIQKVRIKSIKYIGKGKVRNLTVKNNHTFITKNGVITHNCDHLSPQAQAALRNLIESTYSTARYLLTANYPKKIIPALHSRVQTFTIDSPKTKDILKRISTIIKKENIEIDEENIDKLTNLAENVKDIRKIIQILQQSTIIEEDKKILKLPDKFDETSEVFDGFIDLFKRKELDELRLYIYQNFTDSDADSFWTLMVDEVLKNSEFYSKNFNIDKIIIELNEGQKNNELVANKLLNILSFVISVLIEDKVEELEE